MTLYLVAFEDDQGPYAVAFSSRQAAEDYLAEIDGEGVVIETELNRYAPEEATP
jgi:hypothetical protein